MHTTIVGVDLAKTKIQVAVANEHCRITKRLRLTRARFEAFVAQHPKSLFVMEACGSSQPWGRKLESLGHEVRLLPAQYVRAYVKRNKTDAADAAALIEASRCWFAPNIDPASALETDPLTGPSGRDQQPNLELGCGSLFDAVHSGNWLNIRCKLTIRQSSVLSCRCGTTEN